MNKTRKITKSMRRSGPALLPAMLCATLTACAVAAPKPAAPAAKPADDRGGPSSNEQGRTSLDESFDWDFREWRLEQRREAFRDTQFKLQFHYWFRDACAG